MQNWAVVASEIINVAAAIIFILLFSFYLYRIKKYFSVTRRFVHLYPFRRIIFVIIYIFINLIEIFFYIFQPVSDDELFNNIELYFLIGTCLNSLILIYQLGILYVEIKRQLAFNALHTIYWFYLACISLMRLILEAYYQTGDDVRTWELVLSSLLLADAIILFVYSWFMKNNDSKQRSNINHQVNNILNESISMRTGAMSKTFEEQEAITSDDGIFPYLTVELRVHLQLNVIIKTYAHSVEVSDQVKNLQELACFYQQTLKFKLKSHQYSNKYKEINIVQLQEFFSELLSDWRYYEPFVLEFLNVNEQTKKQINRCRSQQSGQTQGSNFDPERIYFDIRLPNIAKNVDHYEFDVIVWTNDHEANRTVHKRYSEFQQLDKKLRSFDFKGLRLKTPQMPQKIYLNQGDEQKLEDRRSKLQIYIKRLLNDKVFIKTYTETRVLLFEFFRLDCQDFALAKQMPINISMNQLSFQKSDTMKQITQTGEPVTFYYFKISLNGSKLGSFKKRFRMFDQFNQQFKRWMHNTQVQYKSVKLPTKIPYASQSQKVKRHHDLTEYLNALVKVPNLQDLYDAKKFLLVYDQAPRLSRRLSSSDNQLLRKSSVNDLIQSSRLSRMSELIDNLNFDSHAL